MHVNTKEHQKNKKIVVKKRWFVYILQVMTSYTEHKQPNSLSSSADCITCLLYTSDAADE